MPVRSIAYYGYMARLRCRPDIFTRGFMIAYHIRTSNKNERKFDNHVTCNEDIIVQRYTSKTTHCNWKLSNLQPILFTIYQSLCRGQAVTASTTTSPSSSHKIYLCKEILVLIITFQSVYNLIISISIVSTCMVGSGSDQLGHLSNPSIDVVHFNSVASLDSSSPPSDYHLVL